MILDDAGVGFFLRQLELVKATAYEVKYADLKGRQLIPVNTEGAPGTEAIVYEQYDAVGYAKVISSYADDLPRVDVKGQEFISRVRSLGDSYGYNVQEIRAAQLANRPLQQRRANAAKRAIQQLENAIAFGGDVAHNMLGLVSHPNVPNVVLAASGTGNTTTWSTKTPRQIVDDMNKILNSIGELTKLVENPNTVLMPIEKMNYLRSTPMDQYSQKSILTFIQENHPEINRWEAVIELKGAGAGGTDRMIVYRRDPSVLEQHIPVDFEQFNAQERGLEMVVPCHERYGGVTVYAPLAIAYADGF